MRSFVASVAVLLVVLLQPACSSAPPCGPSTCQGCCAADGQCVTATTASACGSSGSACITCNVGASCVLGACSSGTGGGGGATGGGGGATGGGGGATGGGGGSAALYPDGGSRHSFWDGGSCATKTDCPCFSSDDCGPGFTCQSEDSSGLNVWCKPGTRGDGGVGAACAVEGDCDSALCTDSNAGMYCSALCSGDGDCPSVLPRCTYIGFGIERSICSPP